MPAICQNVRNWHADTSKSKWIGRWDGWFTYDFGSSKAGLYKRGNDRRNNMCPRTWKGTIANPRCPEPNQPAVVPPLWDANGVGVTGLKPQRVGATDVSLRIADGRDAQFVGQTQPSGRRYTCDEFPAASWIEGGSGYFDQVVDEGSGGPGTTYCAPMAASCPGGFDGRGSEQNWQGTIHAALGGVLEERLKEDPGLPDATENDVAAFQFTYFSTPNEAYAARVLWDDTGARKNRPVIPGTHWVRSDDKPSRMWADLIPTTNGSMAIVLTNGEVFHAHEENAVQRAVKRAMELSPGNNAEDSSPSDGLMVPEWCVKLLSSLCC
jgi:chitinase